MGLADTRFGTLFISAGRLWTGTRLAPGIGRG
jgi:hypothetical protein